MKSKKNQSWNWKMRGCFLLPALSPLGTLIWGTWTAGGWCVEVLPPHCAVTSAHKTIWDRHKSTTINASGRAARPYVPLQAAPGRCFMVKAMLGQHEPIVQEPCFWHGSPLGLWNHPDNHRRCTHRMPHTPSSQTATSWGKFSPFWLNLS